MGGTGYRSPERRGKIRCLEYSPVVSRILARRYGLTREVQRLTRQYYIRSRGTVRGPFPAEKLQELARRGKFNRFFHVSLDQVTWEPASRYPELFPETRPAKIRKRKPQAEEAAEYELQPQQPQPQQPQSQSQQPQPGGPTEPTPPGDSWEHKVSWYYARDGREMGPATFAQLQQLAGYGELQPNDFVWAEGMPDWIEAAQVTGLFPDSSPTAGKLAGGANKTKIAIAIAGGVLGLLFLAFVLAVWIGLEMETTGEAAPPGRPPGPMSDAEACAVLTTGCGGFGGCLGFSIVASIAILVSSIALLVWVARDAKARGMDGAALWMLLVMFTHLIGLIVYIFSRPQGSLLQCQACGNKRLQASALCPHCGNP